MDEDRGKKEEIFELTLSGLIAESGSESSQLFEAIYSKYYLMVYRFIFFRLKRKEDTEDLVQTVFYKALSSFSEYRDIGKPIGSWLFTIARNLLIDHYKKKKDQIVENPEQFFSELRDDGESAVELMVKKERLIELADAITKLPEEQQEVIILRSIEERSYEEVAEIMNKNEEAIRAIKYRALKNLKQILNNEKDGR